MITRFHVENFKSLVDFDLPEEPHQLGPFVCLVGMNGSGKTTVLQAFDFLAQLVHGRMDEWLERRGWVSYDLASRIPKKLVYREMSRNGKVERVYFAQRPSVLIPFSVQFDFDGEKVEWSGRYNRNQKSCTWECVKGGDASRPMLTHQEGSLRYLNENEDNVEQDTTDLVFTGSILSAFNLQHPLLKQVRSFMSGLKSLEMLTPQAMRRRSRKGEDIGYGGEKLSAFLDSLSSDAKQELLKRVQEYYPSVQALGISTARGGWKKLFGRELHRIPFSVSSSHMSDGMLRVIAILAQAHSQHPVLLFDEIENGINSELVERLVSFLVGLKKQVIVTTHSPMILNYLDDELAKQSVYFLYRDSDGWTRSVRFYEIPEVGMKLEALGPGEAFVDTNLTNLTERLAQFEPAREIKT